eukprot:288115-Chlamydomonas_euryale.AAC.1
MKLRQALRSPYDLSTEQDTCNLAAKLLVRAKSVFDTHKNRLQNDAALKFSTVKGNPGEAVAEHLPRNSHAYCLRRSFGDAPPMVEVQRALLELLPRRSPEVASFKTNYALMNKQHTDIHALCAEITQVCGSAFWPRACTNIAGTGGGRVDTKVGSGRGRWSGGEPARGGGGRGRGRGTGACFKCGQHGHIAFSCPHADVIAQAIATSKSTPQVFWAGATLVGPGVYLDTRADTYTLCVDKSFLTGYREDAVDVTKANGVARTEGVGVLTLATLDA